MDDMERYGDYNEIDEPPQKSKGLLIIKIIAFTLIFSVIGLLAFRIILFNYYPKAMKELYFNEALTAYYNEKDGEIGAKTQKLKAPYDDEKEGNFMCDNLIFIPELGQLQISVRLNENLYEKLAEELSLSGDLSTDIFSFKLEKLDFAENGTNQTIEAPSNVIEKSFIMYDFCKVVFDGIDFTSDTAGYWMVLEIYVKGQKGDDPYAKVLVLDGTEEYYSIKDYNLSGGEKP